MAEIQLGVIEARYADMIWEHEPVSSSELVKLTEEAFHWKRTTAHNVLRRLCDKGLFRNDNGTVTSLISREEFYAMQSRQFVEDTFEGSLPAFLAAFTKDRVAYRRGGGEDPENDRRSGRGSSVKRTSNHSEQGLYRKEVLSFTRKNTFFVGTYIDDWCWNGE